MAETVWQRALHHFNQAVADSEALERQFPSDVWKHATEERGEFREPTLNHLKASAIKLGYKVDISKGKVTLTK